MWGTVWNVKSSALSVTLKLRICKKDTDDSVHVDLQPLPALSLKHGRLLSCVIAWLLMRFPFQVIHVETQNALCTNAWL